MKPLNILGLTIFAGGILILAGFATYIFIDEIFTDSDLPAVVKIGIIAVLLGIIIMLGSLVVERIRDAREEK